MEDWINIAPKKEMDISWEELKKLMVFNTPRFWWCYFDVKTKILYNQYANIVLEDATEYLLSNGLIDENFNQLKSFQE